MVLHVPDVLTAEQLAFCRRILDGAEWVDGRVTAGPQSGLAKRNRQIPEDHPAARQLGEIVLASLERSPLFVAGALPQKIFPPLFNRYEGGETFGAHVDNAIRQVKNGGWRVRTDLSATLFLNAPEEYDGGELVVDDVYGAHRVKLAAGHLVLYPASSLHHVRAVTRGVRLASFFWVQSMVRDDGERSLLFDLDLAIQRLARSHPEHGSVVALTAVYHNLIRRWADV